jgi:hypothetical protein
MAGRFLAQFGSNPSTGFSFIPPERARRINALMLTCGHYGGSSIAPPSVWLMCQAGRYLPEYWKVRAEAGSFLDLCYTRRRLLPK